MMRRIRYVSKDKLCLFALNFFLIFPHFKTPYMDQVGALDIFFNLWRVASACYILMKLVKKPQISPLVFAFCIFQGIYMVSTVINEGNIRECFLATVSILSFSIYVDACMNTDERYIVEDVIRVILEILIYVNLATIILIPDGMYKDWTWRNWFLGTDNQHVAYYVVGFVFSVVCSIRKKSYLRLCIFTVAIYASTFITFSGTAVGGMVVYGVIVVIVTLVFRNKKLKFGLFYLFPTLIFVMIVIMRVQDIFSVIITDWIGKDLTFTGRTFIWDRAIYWFLQSPIIGNGIEFAALHTEKTIFPSTHNTLLGYAYNGGILALGTFASIIGLVSQKINSCANEYIPKVIAISISVLFFMMIFEEYKQICLYLLYILGYNVVCNEEREVT